MTTGTFHTTTGAKDARTRRQLIQASNTLSGGCYMNKRQSRILHQAPRTHDPLAERDIESEIAHLSPLRTDE